MQWDNILITLRGIGIALVVLALWELYWKGKALWAAARNSQSWWFIALLVINSAGILPIIYILFFQKKK